jgi:hypothetical protein
VIHARTDYDRIQDPAELIPTDEPVLLLRGKDPLGWVGATYYRDALVNAGGQPEMIEALNRQIDRMRAWWNEHDDGRIVPDMPSDAVRSSDG